MTQSDEPHASALEVALEGGVLRLTKRNAEVGYGISRAMVDALTDTLKWAAEDSAIRAVLIDAPGNALQTGAVMLTELKPELDELTREDIERLIEVGHELGRAISALPKPVIAVARGGALGGGLELMLRSDFIFTLDDAQFSLPEVTLGLVAGWGGTQLAGRTMPFRMAQEFLLLGHAISGARAAQLGLVTRSFADAQALEDHLKGVLDRLRVCSPASVQWTKRCLAAIWEGSLRNGEAQELIAEVETISSGDILKAVPAYFAGAYFDFINDASGGPR